MDMYHSHTYVANVSQFSIDPEKIFVQLPKDLASQIQLPNMAALALPNTYVMALILGMAILLETVLTTRAMDRMSASKSVTDQSKDLVAVGVGNFCSALFGGLPLISESKRSILAQQSGSQSALTNFVYGILMVLLTLNVAPYLNFLPKSALAAILVFTGARMATPSEFSKSYQIGPEQFLVFITTIVFSFFTNFVIGIVAGLLLELMIHLRFGVSVRSLFVPRFRVSNGTDSSVFRFKYLGPAIFSNFYALNKQLQQVPYNTSVEIDLENAPVIDHSFMEHLYLFQERKQEVGIQILLKGMEYHKNLSHHPLASKRMVRSKALSERQDELRKWCSENEFLFDARMRNEVSKFSDFTLDPKKEIMSEENCMKTIVKGIPMEISDIFVKEQKPHNLSLDLRMTVFMMTNLPAGVPNFTLRKEGFVDTLFSLAGYNDIDFSEFPNFSHYYFLMGRNELEIRNFFKPSLIQFFEKNKGLHFECTFGKLLVFKKMEVLSLEEIQETFQVCVRLLELIASRYSSDE